ncbi:hypothetical protein [Anaeromicropila populeti]|uniref:Uncharacterized protein n=1 Tax=Anaeromicropila populeti TaxID=37658 RepID=A0A1I6JA45_9FIRM|nr:hypothetical protein [Anaeromicropila populeti]SFR75853.1 hypothetical protein SAMN05661086_01499 [Anaeromicropila populeti]
MKKIALTVGLCLCTCMLAGCKSKMKSLDMDDVKTSTILIRSDGTVQSSSVENFEKEYYSESELKDFIDDAVSEYNDKTGEKVIKLEDCEVNDQKASMILTYDSLEHYKQLNEVETVSYTMEEAVDADIFPEKFVNAVDGSEALLKEVTADTSYKVLYVEEATEVIVPEAIKFYSNAMLLRADSVQTTGEEPAVIIYK